LFPHHTSIQSEVGVHSYCAHQSQCCLVISQDKRRTENKAIAVIEKAAGDGWGGGYYSRYPPTQ